MGCISSKLKGNSSDNSSAPRTGITINVGPALSNEDYFKMIQDILDEHNPVLDDKHSTIGKLYNFYLITGSDPSAQSRNIQLLKEQLERDGFDLTQRGFYNCIRTYCVSYLERKRTSANMADALRQNTNANIVGLSQISLPNLNRADTVLANKERQDLGI